MRYEWCIHIFYLVYEYVVVFLIDILILRVCALSIRGFIDMYLNFTTTRQHFCDRYATVFFLLHLLNNIEYTSIMIQIHRILTGVRMGYWIENHLNLGKNHIKMWTRNRVLFISAFKVYFRLCNVSDIEPYLEF